MHLFPVGQFVDHLLTIRDNRTNTLDIQIVFPGVHLLTDVVVSHPLRAGVTSVTNAARLGIARQAQAGKHKSYDETATRHDAVLLPFSVETCGGMAEDAVELLDRIAT